MFLQKRTSFILMSAGIGFLCLCFLLGGLIGVNKDEVLNTEFTYSDSTLSAIVYADSDTSDMVNDVEIEVVFEEKFVVEDYMEVSISENIENSESIGRSVEMTVEDIELSTQQTLENVGTEYVDEKIKESQITHIVVRGIELTYDPSLSYIDKTNLPERFKVFAPNDNYNKVLEAMSKMALGEAGGCSPTEIAATVWSVLNRYDNGYASSIYTVITAPNQYHGYNVNHGLRKDVYDICEDVIARWVAEKEGVEEVGRVLPADYKWFYGDGAHNHFRNKYRTSSTWNWSLPTPYNDLSMMADRTNVTWL